MSRSIKPFPKPSSVIPGLDPGIHLDFELLVSINVKFKMDCRVKPGNDGGVVLDCRVRPGNDDGVYGLTGPTRQ